MIEDIAIAGLVAGAATGLVHVPVTGSSNVLSYAYSPATMELEVEFKGNRTYTFEGVTPDVAFEFARAPSKGGFLNSALKGYSFHLGAATIAGAVAGLGDLAEGVLETPLEVAPSLLANNDTPGQPDQPSQYADQPAATPKLQQPGQETGVPAGWTP